jgi:eukaryotic-like serine/threonine-protein kinase
VAGGFPALTGRLPRALDRAAAGALGAWWLLLAEALLPDRFLLGAPQTRAGGAHAVQAVATAPGVALVGIWAVAALLLPLFVRGRLLAADAVGATAWAAGLTVATQAATGAPPGRLIAGGLAAGALAVLVRSSPGASDTR